MKSAALLVTCIVGTKFRLCVRYRRIRRKDLWALIRPEALGQLMKATSKYPNLEGSKRVGPGSLLLSVTSNYFSMSFNLLRQVSFKIFRQNAIFVLTYVTEEFSRENCQIIFQSQNCPFILVRTKRLMRWLFSDDRMSPAQSSPPPTPDNPPCAPHAAKGEDMHAKLAFARVAS